MDAIQMVALLVVVAGLLLGLFIVANLNRSRKEPNSLAGVSGHIEQPGRSESTSRTIHCRGTIQQDVHSPDVAFWLAIETDGLVWPKEPRVQPDSAGRWAIDIREDGYPDTFSISL